MQRTKTTHHSGSSVQYKIEEEPIVISKALMDLLLEEEDPSFLISLYCFYYYTAKWQGTNQPKCTTRYVAEGLHTSERKVRIGKSTLQNLGLISNIKACDSDSKRITGHFIKINFLWTKPNPLSEPGGRFTTVWDSKPPNALRTNNKKTFSEEFIEMFPLSWRTDKDFPKIIKEFVQHRSQKRQKLTPLACKKLSNKLKTHDLKTVISALNHSIENGWTGVFPESEEINGKKNRYQKPFIVDPDLGRFDLCEDGRYRHCVSGDIYIP